MYLEDLGDKIRERRKRLGISQQELAEAAGYTSKVAISRIESGQLNLTMDKLVAIAKCLDVPVSELLHAEEKRTDLDPIIEEIKSYSPEDLIRLRAYMDLIRSVNYGNSKMGRPTLEDPRKH